MLKTSFAFVVLMFFGVSSGYAEEVYTPPTMFSAPAPVSLPTPAPLLQDAVPVSPVVKKRVHRALVKPVRKPSVRPVQKVLKPTVTKVQKTQKSKSLGVSKKTIASQSVNAPKVEAVSLMPPATVVEKQDFDRASDLETSIAFLPASVDLTRMQRDTLKRILTQYFFERDAEHITVKVYASLSDDVRNSAKRKALARGLNIRDWLTAEGLTTQQITLKAIGSVTDGKLPDRADIIIRY